MEVFVTSDHHFNHSKIIGYCNRPFGSVNEMNEFMIGRWNSKVNYDDLVFHLGDFGFGGKRVIKGIRDKLNGTIILIRDKHDYQAKIKPNRGFIIVKSPVRIENYVLTHRPLEKKDIPKGYINVHGHMHEKESLYGINISVDRTDYYPVNIKDLNLFR